MINAKYNMLQKVTRHGSVSPFAFDCIWHLTMASTNNYLLELLFSPIRTRFVWHSFRSWPGGAGHQEGAGEEPAGISVLGSESPPATTTTAATAARQRHPTISTATTTATAASAVTGTAILSATATVYSAAAENSAFSTCTAAGLLLFILSALFVILPHATQLGLIISFLSVSL